LNRVTPHRDESAPPTGQALAQPVINLVDELHLIVEGVAPGGEFGAIFVRDRDGRPLVLKAMTGAHRSRQWERGVTIARRLRTAGYPAPEYIATGTSGDLVWSVQERIGGRLPEPLRLTHTSTLLDLTSLHIGAAADLEPIGSEQPNLALSLASAQRLQDDERTSAVAKEAAGVLRHGIPDGLRSSDVRHGDFHHRNLLVNGDSVIGVFDWENAGRGDWRFDVATLAFWSTVAAAQVEDDAVTSARARAEEVCERALLAYFTAALAMRLLGFYLHARPDLVDIVLPAITDRVLPWWQLPPMV
jgi:aminoglycoside phosphotransferase (APT) family kinase protein